MTLPIDAENAFDNLHPFIINIFSKMGMKKKYFNIIKAIYDIASASNILNSKKLKAFPLGSAMRQECPFSPLLFNLVPEVLAKAIKQEKK